MRKAIIPVIAGVIFLAGCGSQGNKSAGVPVDTKWKGAPYRLTFDTATGKPNLAAITLPPVKFTADPEALETRAILVMRFTASAASDQSPHLLIGMPVDIHGKEGALPADYLDKASKSLTDYLGAYCVQGKVKVTVALARSSVKPHAEESEVNAKLLSDWLPLEVEFKKPHSKC